MSDVEVIVTAELLRELAGALESEYSYDGWEKDSPYIARLVRRALEHADSLEQEP